MPRPTPRRRSRRAGPESRGRGALCAGVVPRAPVSSTARVCLLRLSRGAMRPVVRRASAAGLHRVAVGANPCRDLSVSADFSRPPRCSGTSCGAGDVDGVLGSSRRWGSVRFSPVLMSRRAAGLRTVHPGTEPIAGGSESLRRSPRLAVERTVPCPLPEWCQHDRGAARTPARMAQGTAEQRLRR